MKKHGIRWHIKKTWTQFSIYIRTRDCLSTTGSRDEGRCFTCGKIFPFKKLQAGHFVPGRRNAILFNEECVHAQCFHCNQPAARGGLGGNILEYRRRIVDMYGPGYDEFLERLSRTTVKYLPCDLDEMADKFKEKTKELLNTKLSLLTSKGSSGKL